MIGIEIQMMLGLAVGIFLMIFLVLKTKIHTFVALIIASAATGLIGGMMPGEVVSCITGGFGSTLGSIVEDMFHDLDKLPSVFASFAPVVLPIILIFLQTAFSAFKVKGILAEIVAFAGSPVIALAAGLILAICMLMAKETRENVLARMEEGAANAGIILLITGAGGAFGNMIRESGIGDHLGEMISGLPLPAILIPFFIATVIRLIQGSGTVSMITAASISAPILSRLEINPAFATMSACMGAMVFSYFNDSLFWIITRMLGITDVREQLRTWSVPTTLLWATGGILLFIAYAVFG